MPYEIRKIKSGYKVCKMSDPDECFSKKPIPMKNAIKQKYAIEISERSKKGGADSDEEEEDEYDEEDEEIRNLFKVMKGSGNKPFIKGKTLIYEKDKIKKLYNYLLPLLQKADKKRIGLIAEVDGEYKGKKLADELLILQKIIDDFPEITDWCKGAKWGHNFRPKNYAVVGLSMELGDDDEIVFTASACCINAGDSLGIAYLCGKNAYLIINAMKDSMNKGIAPLFVDASFNKVELSSADTCNTIEFYNKQGFLTEKSNYNIIHDNFKEEFEELKEISKTPLDAINKLKEIFSGENNSCSDNIQHWFNSIGVGTEFILLKDNQNTSEYSSIDFYNEIKKKWIPEIVSEYEEENKVGKGIKGTKFYEQLKKLGIDEKKYMIAVKLNAKKNKYDPKLIDYAMDDVHKLKYSSPDGVKYFGRVGYGDFLIYKLLEGLKKVEKGTADKKRNVFHKSHEAITKKNNLGVYSPNELALNILW